MNKGFTLIETLIYLALLTFIIGTGVAAAFFIITSTATGGEQMRTVAEAEFLMRKIDWAMTGATSVNALNMQITKGGSNIQFDLDTSRARILIGGDAYFLTSENVKVTGLEFIALGSNGIKASTTIDGKHFEITKYIRE